MIYIKLDRIYDPENDKSITTVRLGGRVANERMIKEGWIQYDGPIPPRAGRYIWDEEAQIVLPDLEYEKERKKEEIAAERFKEETGGITLDNGIKIRTDRESQFLLMGAALFADKDPNYTVEWKSENGWIILDAPTILELASLVRQHVQSCFNKEKQLNDQIDAATSVEEVQSIKWSYNL